MAVLEPEDKILSVFEFFPIAATKKDNNQSKLLYLISVLDRIKTFLYFD